MQVLYFFRKGLKLKIVLASDHGGYDLKREIFKHLHHLGYECVDMGTDSATESVDYPDFAKKAADAVASGDYDKGILFCGTGQGIGMSANKVKGIRCAILSDVYSARMTAAHNDANMIAMGGRVLGVDLAKEIVTAFLEGSFEGGRHQRRVDKISDLEK